MKNWLNGRYNRPTKTYVRSRMEQVLITRSAGCTSHGPGANERSGWIVVQPWGHRTILRVRISEHHAQDLHGFHTDGLRQIACEGAEGAEYRPLHAFVVRRVQGSSGGGNAG
jgi:hypothetical protein